MSQSGVAEIFESMLEAELSVGGRRCTAAASMFSGSQCRSSGVDRLLTASKLNVDKPIISLRPIYNRECA
jgi:hypothetical protein